MILECKEGAVLQRSPPTVWLKPGLLSYKTDFQTKSIITAQKMKKSLMENFNFWAVNWLDCSWWEIDLKWVHPTDFIVLLCQKTVHNHFNIAGIYKVNAKTFFVSSLYIKRYEDLQDPHKNISYFMVPQTMWKSFYVDLGRGF